MAEVLHLLRPPSALFGPGLLARVAWDRLTAAAIAYGGALTALGGEVDGSTHAPGRTAADLEIKTAADSLW
jgi:hypothetical protein